MKEAPPMILPNNERFFSPEKKATMEAAHLERLQIVVDSFNRTIKDVKEAYANIPQSLKSGASVGLNWVPILGETKLSIEGLVGKTLSGQKLTNTNRLLQVISAATSALGKILVVQGTSDNSSAEFAGGLAISASSYVPMLYSNSKEIIGGLKNTLELLKTKIPNLNFKRS